MFENSEDFDFNDDFNIDNDRIDEILNKNKQNSNNSANKSKNIALEHNTVSKNIDNLLETSLNELKSDNIAETSTSSHKVLKRKFPGPAGLLPDRRKSSRLNEDISDKNSDENDSDVILCSQAPQSKFSDGLWCKMMEDFSNYEFLLEKFTINWLKTQAKLKKLHNQKMPFLVAVIESLDVSDTKIPTINVTLKDKTGSIQATILNNLYEEYAKYLMVGSVVVLKQFGVLTTGENNNYLTITLNNLLTIYFTEKAENLDEIISKILGVKKISINEVNFDEITKNVEENKMESPRKTTLFTKPNLSKLRVHSSTSMEKSTSVTSEKSTDTDSFFDEEFNIPDNFEEIALTQASLKNKSQECNKNDKNSDIIKSIFEGVNTDDIFDDF